MATSRSGSSGRAGARRLLPAIGVLLVGVTIYSALFRRDALGQLRGDVLAAITYVSNWYQIWVGQGYTRIGRLRAAEAPVEPRRRGAVLPALARSSWPPCCGPVGIDCPASAGGSPASPSTITAVVAMLMYRGPVGTPAVTPDAYWTVGGRPISKLDFLYLSTPTRAIGLLLGAAFAMIWRPAALLRGPMRERGRLLDVVAAVGMIGLAALCWYLRIVTPDGADPWLFRGGFLVTGLATLCVIAAVTHQRSATGRVLGTTLLVWIGTRSYGLYLYHWPIFQGIRRIAGTALTGAQFVVAMAVTAVVAELSYRYVEMPVRRRTVGRAWRRLQLTASQNGRRALAVGAASAIVLVAFAGAGLATARVTPNAIEAGPARGRGGGR